MFILPPFHITSSDNNITSIHNFIPNTVIVAWVKNFPLDPQVYSFTKQFTGQIFIPKVTSQDELLGSHLEIRIMTSKQDHCLARILLWEKADHLCLAIPNDKKRDIDNLQFDLDSTKKTIKMKKPHHLVFQKCAQHLFVKYQENTIAIESFYE